jgi:lycopene beta-cyclase
LFTTRAYEFDYALVGGGLQAGLIALALHAASRSDAHDAPRIAIVERGARLGGEHLWSFHAGDVPAEARHFVEPLVIKRWPRWRATFPRLDRTFERPYASISSQRLHDVVVAAMAALPGSEVLLEHEALQASAHEVVIAGPRGPRTITAGQVIDARGPDRAALVGRVAFQKFVGLELSLARPLDEADAEVATVFDATVEQRDGFRFFYVLPFTRDRVLVEETFYADGPALDRPALRASILGYAAARGLAVREVVREEVGVLPLPVDAAPAMQTEGAHAPAEGRPLLTGYAGGFFHPTTGYSLPLAARVASVVASTWPQGPAEAARALAPERVRVARQARYCALLNRLLFRAIAEDARRNVLERFHTLPEETVLRFYALDTTPADRARILCGRPPRGMSLHRALSTLLTRDARGTREGEAP